MQRGGGSPCGSRPHTWLALGRLFPPLDWGEGFRELVPRGCWWLCHDASVLF